MSFKVYNAYRWNGTIHELMDELKSVRKKYHEHCVEFISNMNKECVMEEENYPFLEKDKKFCELNQYDLARIINKEIDKGTNHPLNIRADAIVYFYTEKKRPKIIGKKHVPSDSNWYDSNEIFVQFFGLPRKWILSDLFEDYHYQNQVDMSNYDWDKEPWETMTKKRQKELEKDWKQREEIWNKILDDDSIPSQCGLEFKLTPIHTLIFANEVINKLK